MFQLLHLTTSYEYKINSKITFYELEKLDKITVCLIYNCLRYISHGCHGDRYFTMYFFRLKNKNMIKITHI